jgi:protein Tex
MREVPAERRPAVVMVNEAGASIYSASDMAREEFPELDLTMRSAVSIARRLQDPLAELVKIDPKSIGVGQYQHDVSQTRLKRRLDETVESCVNRVGVEVNTASPALLSYVAGIGPTVAQRIVQQRDAAGAFRSRAALLKVPGAGAEDVRAGRGLPARARGRTPAGRLGGAPGALRAGGAHRGGPAVEVAGRWWANEAAVSRIEPRRYVGGEVGLPTLEDIVAELRKPGRDPRDAFEAPAFRDDVQTLDDLREGMMLEGTVTNVVAFGAFVDVGVHQDGLVHVSQLSDRFVRDPNDVVRVGDRVKVRVVSVDVPRKRIALSMKREAAAGPAPGVRGGARDGAPAGRDARGPTAAAAPAPAADVQPGVAPNGMRINVKR